MGKYFEQFNELEEKRKQVQQRLDELEKDEKIIKLRELEHLRKELIEQKNNIERDATLERYQECDHLLVVSRIVYGRTNKAHKNFGCLKCGLDDSLILEDNLIPRKYIDINSYIRNNMLKWKTAISDKNTNIVCDIDLARAIYLRIIEYYPNIDDDTLKKYFIVALNDIRNINVNKKRKESRAKRLNLLPNYNYWNEESVTQRF